MEAYNPQKQELSQQLLTTVICGWKPIRYLARGASAIVFEATREGSHVALKIFDPGFLEKHSKDAEVERINRQLDLKSHGHPNLVDILDGGYCEDAGLYYLVMPLIEGSSLDKVLSLVPKERIGVLIAQVASAARFLETKGFIHRDIKPANIALSSDFSQATLLDLGVVRPLGVSDVTDSTAFVGTTRYSPPEFLLRTEDQTPEGFRAITFYQLGAVIHDLLTQRPLFHNRTEPIARLIQAVMLESPEIDATDLPSYLVRLARMCLLKDPRQRLSLVSWESFSTGIPKPTLVPDLLKRIQSAQAAIRRQVTPSSQARAELESVHRRLVDALRDHCIQNRSLFPPFTTLFLPARDANICGCVLCFAPSVSPACPSYVHVMIDIVLADEATKLFDLCLGLLISQTEISVEALDLPRPNAILRRASEEEINEAAQRGLYAAFATALEHALLAIEHPDQPCSPIPIEGLQT